MVKNRENSPEIKIATYDFRLPADAAAVEYRVEFSSTLLTASWPPPGAKLKKLVLERLDQFMSGVRVTGSAMASKDDHRVSSTSTAAGTKNQQSKNDQHTNVRLRHRCNRCGALSPVKQNQVQLF